MDGHIKHKRAISGNSPDRINLKKANFISTYIQTKKKSIKKEECSNKQKDIIDKNNQPIVKDKINIFAKLKDSSSSNQTNKPLSKSRVKSSAWYIMFKQACFKKVIQITQKMKGLYQIVQSIAQMINHYHTQKRIIVTQGK